METSNSNSQNPFNLDGLELGTIIRTKSMGTYKVNGSKAWGRYLSKIPDPDGISISKKIVNGFRLKPDFPKIPADLWARYIALGFYMCPPDAKKLASFEHDSQLEVSVCLLRDQATLTKWKIVVPKQIVDGARVEADLRECIDIETGEEYRMFPPPGWLHAGSSHSHNTMGAFFSSVDDASELAVPGLHIVIGEIDHGKMEYSHIASIVHQKQRREVDLFSVVDASPQEECPFHDNVLGYINVVLDKNKQLWRKKAANSPWRMRGPDLSWQIPTEPPAIEDATGKLGGFYRFLNRGNSDLFDDLAEDVDIFSLSDDDLKLLAKKDPDDADILRDIASLESNDEV